MAPKNYLIVLAVVFSGCSHLFVQKNEAIFIEKLQPIEVVCFRKGESLQSSQILESNDKWFGKRLNKFTSKFSNLKVDCSSPKALNFLIYLSEKEEFGDFWVITLGIVPGIYLNDLNIKAFSPEGKIVLEKNIKAKNVISIFLIPFFFFNHDISDVTFDEIERYLEESLSTKSNLK